MVLVYAIELFGGGCLVVDVEQGGGLHLHAEGQFHLVELRIGTVGGFEFAQKAEMPLLPREGGIEILPSETRGFFIRPVHRGSAVARWEKSSRAIGIGRSDVDVGRQILVHAAQAVDEPTTQGGAYLHVRSRVEHALRRDVIVRRMVEGVDEAQLVDKARVDFGKKIARVCSTLSPLLPCEGGGDDGTLFCKSELRRQDGIGEGFPQESLQSGLVIVRVEVRNTSLQKDEDDSVCRWSFFQKSRGGGIRGGES